MITYQSNQFAANDEAVESPSQTLSRLIAEMLKCERTDSKRAAAIRRRIDALADEIEIQVDLAALAVQRFEDSRHA